MVLQLSELCFVRDLIDGLLYYTIIYRAAEFSARFALTALENVQICFECLLYLYPGMHFCAFSKTLSPVF